MVSKYHFHETEYTDVFRTLICVSTPECVGKIVTRGQRVPGTELSRLISCLTGSVNLSKSDYLGVDGGVSNFFIVEWEG